MEGQPTREGKPNISDLPQKLLDLETHTVFEAKGK
jgi:hypothetical protein